ncbi:probable E3 ubiquitin-protein ligase HERC4 isoform X2 [Belonocnema kinseyi]|uniref:probable E3 ubiquitin-protein ligase HERC4 isoform X2 n=1 Tax=Belonocnema kinseyi TaxID=2817044 RepID=UPI00143D8EF4|nr:probable E3 ubiquitin-protein ligase HERC4 isoform X2 [Belonocnema kinseyi]
MEPYRMANWSKKRRLDSEFNLIEQSPPEEDKNMFCWGSTVNGELGLGGIEEENILIPREVIFAKATEVEQIACGENYSIVITRDGQIYSCGNNDFGQLGHLKEIKKKLEHIPGLEAFVFKKAACGACHTLVVNEWGNVYCWGCNTEGQLGLDSSSFAEPVPRMIKALGTSVVVQIACGLKHTLALTNNGELYAWGSNKEGQLGLGPGIRKELKPKLVSSLAGIPIAFIACGGYHSLVVSKSGAIFGWGRNTFGQLGLNDTTERFLPTQLRTLRNSRVRYMACGEEFSVFLTMDGGVFTCGNGMYGQLGHGTYSNEILPRQVVELMGSIVTQISCGRQHTLALVPKGGRVYAWGLSAAGQLGIRVCQKNIATPQVVLGPWLSPSDIFAVKVEPCSGPFGKDCVVKHIFSGGNHCFATVTQRSENIAPDDCRKLEPSSQVVTVMEEQLMACQQVPSEASVDHELLTYLETVFRSLACINASFLLANDAHYGCSSKHHGVDITKANKLFDIISNFKNNTMTELIFSCVTESLLPSLVNSPPDVETLRVYLILPLYNGFANPPNCSTLHLPFATSVLNLQTAPLKIVGRWWSNAPAFYFERLVRTYKAVVQHFLQQPNFIENKVIPSDSRLRLILNLLKFLDELNYSPEGQRVHYSVFHLPELIDIVDIKVDYFRWLTEVNAPTNIFFCDYPFLFDATAKTALLETDQAIQMQSAMNEATTRALTHMLFAPILGGNPNQHDHVLMLEVSRENIVDDTLRELSHYESRDLKKPLRVKFRGEEAEDAGGVRKEFFMLLLKEILDTKYGMFKDYKETRTIWFNEFSFEDVQMYYLIGVLCGLVIYNFIIINLPFPLALYKKLLQEPVGLGDINDMDPVFSKSLQDILDYERSDFEDVFGLNFEITREFYGAKKSVELIPGGSTIPVTLENKKEYVNLMVDYILNKSVEAQFTAFDKGFHKVCGGRVLKLFHSQELMAVVVGNENYDWQELERNASYKEGYTKDDPTVVLFWQVFHELTLEEKKKFLLFLTGSDRIPIQGMKAIKITIQPMSDEKYLPVAHTCFNLLDLPRYQTRKRLQYKLLQAIQQTQGFSLV